MRTSQLTLAPTAARTVARRLLAATLSAGALLLPLAARAGLLGPYTPDTNTLFLLHFDEAAGGSVTTNVGLKGGSFYSVNLATAVQSTTPPVVTDLLGAAGYAGFGNCMTNPSVNYLFGYDYNRSGAYDADYYDGVTLIYSADRLAMSNLNIGNGGQTPFTIEALIQPTRTNGTTQIIIACDSSNNGSRGPLLYIDGGGLTFVQVTGGSLSLTAPIPSSGPHAFVANAWYHVAFTYDGTTGRLYWTRLDPSFTQANLLDSKAMVIGTTSGAAVAPLDIGGENRAANTQGFVGSIDEVRISKVARAATEMQFNSYQANITCSVLGNTLRLTWPQSCLGWVAQSNSLNVASPAAWYDIAGSASGTNLAIPITPGLPKVFYRLRSNPTNSPPILEPTDPRIISYVDASLPLASYPWNRYGVQAGRDPAGNNIARDLTTFPEPGYLDWIVNQYTVMRGTDPADASRQAFRHKIIQGMSYRDDGTYLSARAAIYSSWQNSSPAVLHDGVPYWAAFAIYVDYDHPFDGSGDHVNILELGHSVTSHNTQSMLSLHLRKDGKLRFWVPSNTVLDGSNDTGQTSVFDFPVTKGTWTYIIIQFRFEWDVTKGPYSRLWRAVGNGEPTKIVDTNVANSYRESAGYHPWKFGLYMWDIINGWGSSSTRTMYTKGLYIFKDELGTPNLDVGSVLAFLRAR